MKNTFKTQFIVSTILLIALCLLKISPDDVFVKAKGAVMLVLTQNTDIREEFMKIKNIFIKDTALDAMAPVAEFASPSEKVQVVKGFGVQDAEESGFHYGVDLKILNNENVCAVQAGEVTEIATNEEYGTYIIIKHSDSIMTLYARLAEIFPDVGEHVEKGQALARANEDDGIIYFEIKKGETYLNPADFIDFGGNND